MKFRIINMASPIRTSRHLNFLLQSLLEQIDDEVSEKGSCPTIHSKKCMFDCNASIFMTGREVADLLTNTEAFDAHHKRLSKILFDVAQMTSVDSSLKVFFVTTVDEVTDDRYLLWFVSDSEANVSAHLKNYHKLWMKKLSR